ncbi:hypothetical protein CHGG_02742 [Chaetomium globosum CBS 148.51]|uniref:Extracellular membrane protein CFEM domain-containing protein n=1 Tax=Chaetomium globosum (strain ATCC 6205 / CBS 148.51 / DSM 1962 / NBRC 6347 / NRRL 1970) TaxID=306901 RepID=Q2HAL2_CHAGB|nr:uncharacterized protein CHGG_02742 [Chaetomium globosum CBS 148.51]EAQ90807.1 hypothetical protein CHGG_02742 [Chaetomium globosum CBS 148.51]
MVLASYIRLALVGAALLFSQAQARFDFSLCADNCVTSSGCPSDSARCMCKEAREILLDSVISCLFFNCKDDLRNFDDAFLDPIEEGCEDSGRDIPRSKLRAAASLATSYIGKLPASTTVKSTPVEVTPTPKPTKKTDPTTAEVPLSSTTTENDSPASTSTVDRQAGESKPTTTAVTPAVVPNPGTQSSATPSESPASDNSDSSGGGGGGDPFSSTGDSAGSAIQPFLALLGLPVVVALLTLE